MLTVKNLTKKFGNFTAVDNLNFEIKKGEIVGLLGPNGAGKTTTMRMITSFLTPTKGKIKINKLPPKKAKPLIGYLPEGNPLYSQYKVLEYLKFIADMHQATNFSSRKSYVVKNCGLESVVHQTIDTLSRGYRQRVGLAAALINDPKLLIMDEPTSGLDPNQQDEIKKLIKKIAKNKAVIFSTHILSEAEAICKKVMIIHHGKLVAEKNINQMKKGNLAKLFKKLTRNDE